MLDGHRIGALILMGGVGRRFGSDIPKQFHRLAGKMVFLYTLDAFLSTRLIDEIILSCQPGWVETVRSLLPLADCPIRIVAGGATRQESSFLGLKGFADPPDIVVIHDAVRPFVSPSIIEENIRQALQNGAVDTCIPSSDTLVFAPDNGKISAIPQRSHYLRGQTPQSFSYPLILAAHRQTKRQDASDDCQLVIDLGNRVSVVLGDENNLKITSELDLFLAEQILRIRLQNKPLVKNHSLLHCRYAVIGGTGGIGIEVCHLIEELGGEAIALSRRTTPLSIDLRRPSSIRRAFQALGPLDGLINCAGRLNAGPLEKLSLQEISRSINVNLSGLILSCKMALIKGGGHVINVASSSFSRGRKDTVVYSSAKAGVVNFTQGWAEERPDLHIHAVIPQRTHTEMRRKNFPDEDAEMLLSPQKVASAIVNLLLDRELTGLLVEVKK